MSGVGAFSRPRARRLVARREASVLCAFALFLACAKHAPMPHTSESGGEATVNDATHDAYSLPVPGLSDAHRRAFFVGNSFFNQNWVGAPASVQSRDGLGPLFNARSCSTCHFKDGRSRPPEPGQPMSTMLLRISVRAPGRHGAPVGDPVYGDQIQGSALPGVAKEADVVVDYDEVSGSFADGTPFALRRPRYRLERLGYGPADPRLLMSPRVAPAIFGLGLLEAVPARTLERLADPEDRDGDGISARVNHVHDAQSGGFALGRFGWKAEQPSVLQQSAGAFLGDMGLSSSLSPGEGYSQRQQALSALPNGGSPEVGEDVLRAIALYARALAVPARRNHLDPTISSGEDLFASAGCAACHLPTLRTEPLADLPELGSQEIHPYSDLLLHDMGPELSDERPSFEAEGNEWRTPPLWGLGLLEKVNGHSLLLHDGRARGVTEAILWHRGEAEAARGHFLALKQSERQALLAFLESL
jgi:CxxC motif-containing protein (DUF1111 family)